ncbi:MAG TPA: cytochrome C [Thermoanaerobaculia bacterium]|jgi:hypothetical protein|nr:cytochrome C [Thermoanaerobaculia bacterium]
MRRIRILPFLVLALGLPGIFLGCKRAPAPEPSASSGSPLTSAQTPAAPPGTSASGQPSPPAIQLSPTIPADVAFGSTISLPALQQDFDIFSWNSFNAVIWPPAPGGGGDPGKKPGDTPAGDNPTVWEGYRNVSNVFLPNGKTPTWDGPVDVPPACKPLYQPGMKVLSQIGKTPDLLSETTEPFETGPLVDQNHQYTRFEIVVNRGMFDYILSNSLYSKAGQTTFTGPVKFPCGGGNQVGAIMIKASWKVMGAGDDASRFHTAKALVYTPATVNPPVRESCNAQTVGLVGLHIGHKVNSAPQWIWSTFEQVDNVPTQSEVHAGMLRSHYNYFDPKCKDCAVNKAPPRPWVPNAGTSPATQVVRLDTLPGFASQSAAAQNQTGQALLKGVNPKSVWQYYGLISTQWPTDPGPGNCTASATDPNGNPAPQFLANATLETYIQGTTPNVSSSCIECHGNAAMTTGAASDFTYVLQRAH